MNHYLAAAITSIIDAKGENIIDNKAEFMNIFTQSKNRPQGRNPS